MIRTGIDLIDIERVQAALERHGERFLQRVFTERELQDCGERVASLAARFAAKEAAAKALGTGIGPVGWKDIEVVYGKDCAPELRLHGEAKRLAQQAGLVEWSLSLTHTGAVAAAVVVGVKLNIQPASLHQEEG